jgi:hypothetical protein
MALAHLLVVVGVVIDVTHRIVHPVAHDITGEPPLTLRDPNPAVDCAP